jgi:hypothetical protein
MLGPAPEYVLAEEMPSKLKNYYHHLMSWAEANKRDARLDTFRFWALKTPALISAAGAGVLSYFQLPSVSVVASAVASFCIAIDGLTSRGHLRNVHYRAYHDLRALGNKLVREWLIQYPSDGRPDNLTATLLSSIKEEEDRIAKYLRNAETLLGIPVQIAEKAKEYNDNNSAT